MIWLLRRWLLRAVVVLVVGFAAVYGGDWAIFKLRRSPHSTVTVNRYVDIPLKGRKTEFDYLGTLDAPCAVSLFPQDGLSPCWQLRRNINQGLTV